MNPLLARHLYGSARKNRFFVFLTLYLLGISLLTLLFVGMLLIDLLFGNGRVSMDSIFASGRALYWFSSILLLLSTMLLAPINALGALASEREQRTLDLLRVTTLSPQAIVLGKLFAACLTGGLYLLSPLPLLMLGYWLGGVQTPELVITLAFLVMTLFSSTAWALFISSLTRKTIIAVFLFYGLTLAVIPIGGVLLAVLQALVYAPVIPAQPFWIEVLMQHGWIVLTALHPLSAAIATESLWSSQGTWFMATLPVERYIESLGTTVSLGTVTLPSPWIPNLCLSLLITVLLLWWTTHRMAQPDR